ncbi:MAG TPA: HEAT repeat domain-containing protein [Candidatus Acidoferrales bacterium]|nr:HEAT repeat domain-containing protein [Candidatus Acidoferrales bacterium]
MSSRPGRRAYLLIGLFALALVLLPFLFWYSTWFGRALSDSDLDAYFRDSGKPRHAQHALVQVGERISHGRDASRWYPQVIAQSAKPGVELRQTAAWIMGQDRSYAPFHEALLRLIHDSEPMVRRNAALSLAAFGDSAARPELDAMLRPYTIPSPVAGAVQYRLKIGEYVNPGTMVAHVGEREVRSPVPGEVRSLDARDGATVKSGEPLAELSADKNHVWEALRALVLVGQKGDLEDVQKYTRPMAEMPEVVLRQAQLTIRAIESRGP